ncbi:hypothetical protein LJC59_01235 [Desulfovibrio sp. OttesenSCG-928-A18]|nr:hypothetical protein [Desulfovibrio sp. OttesenSCG-928-A18]
MAKEQGRDTNDYRNTPENKRNFTEKVQEAFSHYRQAFLQRFKGYVPVTLMGQITTVSMDSVRLQKAVESMYLDIDRCVSFHPLMDDAGGVRICAHKVAGFFAKWFMVFTPIIVPARAVDAFRAHVISYHERGYEKLPPSSFRFCSAEAEANSSEEDHRLRTEADNAYAAYDELQAFNEHFALQVAMNPIMDIPEQHGCFLHSEEREVMLYMLSYRVGRLDGLDLALTFHWMQQTLALRPVLAYTELQLLEHMAQLPNADATMLRLRDRLREHMKLVDSLLPKRSKRDAKEEEGDAGLS